MVLDESKKGSSRIVLLWRWYMKQTIVFYLMTAILLLLSCIYIPLCLAVDKGRYYNNMSTELVEIRRTLIVVLVVIIYMGYLKLSDRSKYFYRITVQTFTAFIIFCFTAFVLYVLIGNFL